MLRKISRLNKVLAFGATAALLTLSATEAAAQGQGSTCTKRDNIVSHLDAKYGETRNNLMLDGRGNLVELFSNQETGTWTLTVTLPGGPTCVLSSGINFTQEMKTAEAVGLES